MTNEEILQKRWKETDNQLNKYYQKYQLYNNILKRDIQTVFDTFSISYDDLFQYAGVHDVKVLRSFIEELNEEGILNGYLKYEAQKLYSRTRIKYSEIIKFMLYTKYEKMKVKLNDYEQNIFLNVMKDAYNQAIVETKTKKKYSLIDDIALTLILAPNFKGEIWSDYKDSVSKYNSEQIYNQYVIDMQQDKKINVKNIEYQKLLDRQKKLYFNRRIEDSSIKFSGALEEQVAGLVNTSLIKGYTDVDKNAKVIFIAEIDERTTIMCQTLNNQIFHVNDWNTFSRYSAIDGKNVIYKVFGLVLGINLPPINNHYHKCRSTVTYQTQLSRSEINELLLTSKEKDAIAQWESFDFYSINRKMYMEQKLTKNEKQQVKQLYTALNKIPYYKAKDNEYIVRTLEIHNDSDINKIIKQHPLNKVYKNLSYEAYSIKGKYHSNPNVYFYVKGSKKAKNMLKYNTIDGNIEVLYQYGKKFITRKYYFENGKHYFLLEEYDD